VAHPPLYFSKIAYFADSRQSDWFLAVIER
jgi:hypothetical protein